MSIFLDIQDARAQSSVMNNMANIYQDQGAHMRGLEFYQKALAIDKEIGDSLGMAVTLMNIGIVHMTQGHFERTLDFFLQGLDIVEERGIDELKGPIFNNLASIYHEMGVSDTAILYFERSLRKCRADKDEYGIARVLANMAEVHISNGEMEAATLALEEALAINKRKGYKENTLGNFDLLGKIELEAGHLEEARAYGDSSLQLGQSSGNVHDMKDASNLLYQVYLAQNEHEKGWEMYRLFIQMRDSIKSEEIQEATIKQQAKFDFEKAQLIEEQAEADALRIEKERLRRKNNLQSALVLFGIIVVFIIGLGVSRSNISTEVSESLVFLSFLILFEFLLILTDPYFEEWTDGAPASKLLINAGLALVIIPLHHFFEKFMKRKLLKKS